jgi:hypothetical protein
MVAGFGATFRRSRTRFNDRLIAPAILLGLWALTATHPLAGIALALIIMCWPFLRWALKLWLEGAFPPPSPPALALALYRQSEESAAPVAPPDSSHGGRKAYLNFELKDAPQARGLRPSRSLSSKFR